MLIYFVRHGQTTANAEKRLQVPETVLSPEGEIQAGKVAERLKEIKINEIWSSPMVRAKKTAEIINQYQNVSIVEEPNLKELKRASIFEGKLISDPSIAGIAEKFYYHDAEDPYAHFQDGESYMDLINRAKDVIAKLEVKSQKVDEDFALVVTAHGIILSTIFMTILLGNKGTPEALLHGVRTLKHENTGITLARFTTGKWKLLTFSDFAHL